MKCLLLALALVTPTVHAVDWPWSERQDAPGIDCIGFLGSGLADSRVTGWSRTELWLAWNRITRDGLPQDASFADRYQAGSSRFDNLITTTKSPDLLDEANGECGLGYR
jgi:hypothetical protein